MPAGRPKGSTSKSKNGYQHRTRSIKARYGKDIYKEWGSLGGNPALLKQRKRKRK
jgi:hypothetical protein